MNGVLRGPINSSLIPVLMRATSQLFAVKVFKFQPSTYTSGVAFTMLFIFLRYDGASTNTFSVNGIIRPNVCFR